jgi:hypothetical protein
VDEGQRDLRGLLHHLAQLSGEGQSGGAVVGRGLDEEHVTAHAGHGQARRHARDRGALRRLRGEPRTAEQLLETEIVLIL